MTHEELLEHLSVVAGAENALYACDEAIKEMERFLRESKPNVHQPSKPERWKSDSEIRPSFFVYDSFNLTTGAILAGLGAALWFAYIWFFNRKMAVAPGFGGFVICAAVPFVLYRIVTLLKYKKDRERKLQEIKLIEQDHYNRKMMKYEKELAYYRKKRLEHHDAVLRVTVALKAQKNSKIDYKIN